MSSESQPHRAPRATSDRLRFAGFEVDLRARELYRLGERIPLQGRPFEVLAALLERPGEVVLRQELRDRLWPGQIVEFDNNLNTALTKLRRALEDTGDAPSIIETLPKRGYRLLVPVERVVEPPAEPAFESSPTAGARGRWTWVLVPLLVAIVGWVVVQRPGEETPPARSEVETSDPTRAPARNALLAVLPFTALDGSAESRLLAGTITEELTNRLAEILPTELGVIAHTSTAGFRDSGSDIAAVRDALAVDYVLEGSVSRSVSGLEVRARFIHAEDQAHLWAESYESTLGDLPRVQRSLAERMASSVTSQLTARGHSTEEDAIDSDAWELYLQARFLLGSDGPTDGDALRDAIRQLEQAVEIAPRFALAWAALADAIQRRPSPASERYGPSRTAAERAIELDPTLAQPHHRLASLALYHRWDWAEAEREFDWALALAPSLAVLHHSRAAWFSTQGRHDEAIGSIDRALRLDPLSVVLHADAGWYFYVARRYEEAIERCRQALELVPDHRGANSYLLHSLVALDRITEAGEVARTLLAIEGAPGPIRERALESPEVAIAELRRYRLEVLDAEYRRGETSPGRLALAHLELGDTDAALDLLEEGMEARWGWIYPFLAVYPQIDAVADDPRVRRMVARIGIPRPASAP